MLFFFNNRAQYDTFAAIFSGLKHIVFGLAGLINCRCYYKNTVQCIILYKLIYFTPLSNTLHRNDVQAVQCVFRPLADLLMRTLCNSFDSVHVKRSMLKIKSCLFTLHSDDYQEKNIVNDEAKLITIHVIFLTRSSSTKQKENKSNTCGNCFLS